MGSSPVAIIPAFKKRNENILTLAPSSPKGQLCFRDRKVTLYHQNNVFVAQKFSGLSVNLRIQSEYRKIRTRKKLRIWTLFTQCRLSLCLSNLGWNLHLSKQLSELIDARETDRQTDRQNSSSHRKVKPFDNQPTRYQKS